MLIFRAELSPSQPKANNNQRCWVLHLWVEKLSMHQPPPAFLHITLSVFNCCLGRLQCELYVLKQKSCPWQQFIILINPWDTLQALIQEEQAQFFRNFKELTGIMPGINFPQQVTRWKNSPSPNVMFMFFYKRILKGLVNSNNEQSNVIILMGYLHLKLGRATSVYLVPMVALMGYKSSSLS